MMGGIAYSHGENVGSNAFNESLSVETDEESIYFKSLGMNAFDSRDKKLSFESFAALGFATRRKEHPARCL
jgi:hypothetical protein